MKLSKNYIVAEVSSTCVVISFAITHIRETLEAERVMDEIDEIVTGFDFEVLVLNFTRIRMLSSSFLGKLIGLRSRLRGRGIELRAFGMSPDVRSGFKMLNLHRLIRLCETEEQAVG